MESFLVKNTEKIFLDGWIKNPIEIEYIISNRGMSSSKELIWNIKGVEHKFKIPLVYIYTEWGSDYQSYFKAALDIFRDDLIEWYNKGLPEDWMKNYYKIYGRLII